MVSLPLALPCFYPGGAGHLKNPAAFIWESCLSPGFISFQQNPRGWVRVAGYVRLGDTDLWVNGEATLCSPFKQGYLSKRVPPPSVLLIIDTHPPHSSACSVQHLRKPRQRGWVRGDGWDAGWECLPWLGQQGLQSSPVTYSRGDPAGLAWPLWASAGPDDGR